MIYLCAVLVIGAVVFALVDEIRQDPGFWSNQRERENETNKQMAESTRRQQDHVINREPFVGQK